jgi:hypothetical protein
VTIIPIPPIQCVRLLQKRIEKERLSTSFTTVEPVVVKPEEDSKKALIKEGIDPEIIYGKVPSRIKSIQDRATAT